LFIPLKSLAGRPSSTVLETKYVIICPCEKSGISAEFEKAPLISFHSDAG
jgi:hypothetical protein